MKITIDLPNYDNPGHREQHADGYDNDPGLCPVCEFELNGLTARLHPLGYVHAELQDGETGPTCLDKAIEQRTADPDAAWLTVARHVAKFPSRHSASTVRAVITALTKIAAARPALPTGQ